MQNVSVKWADILCMSQQLRHVPMSWHVRKCEILLGNNNAFILFVHMNEMYLPSQLTHLSFRLLCFLSGSFSQRRWRGGLSTWRTAVPLLPGVFLGLPVTSSPQVVIRVMATEMIKHQEEEEEGSKQCGGLWCHILLILRCRSSCNVRSQKNPNCRQITDNMHNIIYAQQPWIL